MASPTKRRPLPALVLLIALSLLTTLVWWRVLHRGDVHAAAKTPCPTVSAGPAVLPRPASVSVSVLNSTNRTGIAKSAAETLTKIGFRVAGYGNDSPKVHVASVAEIRFGPDQKRDATLIAYYFPGAKLVPLTSDPAAKVVVSLGTKYKGVAAARAALSAMKANHVTIAAIKSSAAPPSGSGSASCPRS